MDNLLSVGWTLRVLQPHPHLVHIRGHCGHDCARVSSLCLIPLSVLCPQLPFIGHQAQQVALVLSELQESVLSPIQAVLLFQRCRLLLACLQYNSRLAQHLRSNFREEFRFVLRLRLLMIVSLYQPVRRLTHVSSLRYFVKPSCAEEKLPPHYPISSPTLRLVDHILTLIMDR